MEQPLHDRAARQVFLAFSKRKTHTFTKRVSLVPTRIAASTAHCHAGRPALCLMGTGLHVAHCELQPAPFMSSSSRIFRAHDQILRAYTFAT